MVCDKSKHVCLKVENHAQELRFNIKYNVCSGLLVHQAYDKVSGNLSDDKTAIKKLTIVLLPK